MPPPVSLKPQLPTVWIFSRSGQGQRDATSRPLKFLAPSRRKAFGRRSPGQDYRPFGRVRIAAPLIFWRGFLPGNLIKAGLNAPLAWGGRMPCEGLGLVPACEIPEIPLGWGESGFRQHWDGWLRAHPLQPCHLSGSPLQGRSSQEQTLLSQRDPSRALTPSPTNMGGGQKMPLVGDIIWDLQKALCWLPAVPKGTRPLMKIPLPHYYTNQSLYTVI